MRLDPLQKQRCFSDDRQIKIFQPQSLTVEIQLGRKEEVTYVYLMNIDLGI